MSNPTVSSAHKMRIDATAMTGARCAEWLRREYPEPRAKVIARDFGASPRTVERWLQGQMPSPDTWMQMVARWGWRFLAHAYEPVVGTTPATIHLREDLAALKTQIAALDARFDALKDEA